VGNGVLLRALRKSLTGHSAKFVRDVPPIPGTIAKRYTTYDRDCLVKTPDVGGRSLSPACARRWREAFEQIELYYSDRWRDFKPLNPAEKDDVIRATAGCRNRCQKDCCKLRISTAGACFIEKILELRGPLSSWRAPPGSARMVRTCVAADAACASAL
jgi:hypothetical protein